MSNTEIKNVLIAGASGSLGSAVVTELLAFKTFNVFVLSREESKATFPTEVRVLTSAYTADALTTLFTSLPTPIDAVVSNLNGPNGLSSAQLALIDASKAAGVKRFFPSEFGVDTSNKEILKILPLLKVKNDILEHVRSKEDDTFSWTAVITGLFLDWGLHYNFLGVDIKAKKFTKWDGGSVPFSATNVRAIAKAIANILGSPERLAATANKYVYISSHTTTQNELYEVVKKSVADGTGEDTWTVENVDSEETTRKAQSALAGGDFSGAYDLVRAVAFGKNALGDHSKLVSNELLGLEKENFEVEVNRAVKEILSAKA